MDSSRKSFPFYDAWATMILNMPQDKAGELIQAIVARFLNEANWDIQDPLVEAMFSMISKKMDEDKDSYNAVCVKRSEAGKASAEANANRRATNSNKVQQKATSVNTCKQVSTLVEDTDTDTEYKTDLKEKEKVKKKKNTHPDYQTIAKESDMSAPLVDTVMDWVAYKQSRNEPYVELGFKKLCSQLFRAETSYGTAKVIEIIESSMAAGYKGIIFDWLKKEKPPDNGIDWSAI